MFAKLVPALALVVAVPLLPAPAQASTDPAVARQEYLTASCPVGAAQTNLRKSWKRAGYNWNKIPWGTRIPKKVRSAYRRVSTTLTNEANLLEAGTPWPASVRQADINRIVAVDRQDAGVAANLAAAGVFRKSLVKWGGSVGKAYRRIDSALNVEWPQDCGG